MNLQNAPPPGSHATPNPIVLTAPAIALTDSPFFHASGCGVETRAFPAQSFCPMSDAQIPEPISVLLKNGTAAEILAATAAHFGCQAGTLHLLRDGMLQLETSLNIPQLIVDLVRTVPVGKGIAGLAAERREPVMLCNLQTDTSGQARPAAKQTGMEGSIAVPMFEGTELRGVLGIAKATAHDWTADEQAILLAIGSALAARSAGAR